jgi:hypothetical protein
MRVNDYALATPAAGDKLFGSNAAGDQKQFAITNFTNAVFQYEVGEYVEDQGGVIFHRYLDGDTQNYLVVGLTDLSSSQAWSNVASTLIGSAAQSTWDGLSNSNAIVSQATQTSSAAKLCLDSTASSQTDWYLPAIDELSLLWQNRFNVNRTLSGNSSLGPIVGATIVSTNIYWSSMELVSDRAWYFTFDIGVTSISVKNSAYYVRAVRKFSI